MRVAQSCSRDTVLQTFNVTPEAANQGFTRHTRNFQTDVLRQAGAKLCRTVALQGRTPLTRQGLPKPLGSGVLPLEGTTKHTVFLRKANVALLAVFLQITEFRKVLYSRFFLSSIALEEMPFLIRDAAINRFYY